MQNDRDRLIELVFKSEYSDFPCHLNNVRIEDLADYLLANGVIVPPNELYSIVDKGTIYATVSKAIVEWLPLYVIKEPEKYGYYKTKEEAEEKLRGLNNG